MSDAATVGDPEAMRALARELLGRAQLVRGLAAPAVGRLEAAVFEGPAATRLRGEATRLAAALAAAAGDLAGVAGALLADAAGLEGQNDALRREAEAAAATQAPNGQGA
ncbi:MAG: hypothetical protein JSS99_10595 [Actinobacteria bacterium]|nr:hypothetical protein [Actinomycetota bacterium]